MDQFIYNRRGGGMDRFICIKRGVWGGLVHFAAQGLMGWISSFISRGGGMDQFICIKRGVGME